jgi:DNA-binding GntR family transcriptional regulator
MLHAEIPVKHASISSPEFSPMESDEQGTSVLNADLAAGRIIRRGSLKDLAYQEIKGLLVSGKLTPDRLYSAQHFAQLLGVSRTPVREALLRLANEGFLVCREVKGFQIKDFSRKEVQDVLETREVIETHVVQRLAGRLTAADLSRLEQCHQQMLTCAADGDETRFLDADQEFHMTLIRRCGNHHLLAIMENIRSQIALFGLKILGHSKDFADIIQEHSDILKALGGTDRNEAVHAMRRHLAATEDRLHSKEKVRG